MFFLTLHMFLDATHYCRNDFCIDIVTSSDADDGYSGSVGDDWMLEPAIHRMGEIICMKLLNAREKLKRRVEYLF